MNLKPVTSMLQTKPWFKPKNFTYFSKFSSQNSKHHKPTSQIPKLIFKLMSNIHFFDEMRSHDCRRKQRVDNA